MAQKFRDHLYEKTLRKRGRVPCFVCGGHIERGKESLEHKRPMILGGAKTNPGNLALSHKSCNARRNSKPLFRLANGVPYEAASVLTPATVEGESP